MQFAKFSLLIWFTFATSKFYLIDAARSKSSFSNEDNVEKTLKFKNIVLEGGGSKAISYVGALLALKEHGYYKDGRYMFEKIGGTSAGCFVGFLMALNIRPSKLEALVYKINIFQNSVNFDLNIFKPENAPERSTTHTWYNTILKTFSLIKRARELVDLWLDYNSPGLSTEERFIEFVTNIILPMSSYKNVFDNDLKKLTFAELYKMTRHDLHCFATQISDKTIYEFSKDRTPNESVLKAIYASITIPGIFKPLDDGNGNTLVDGGLLYNFPITMNDYGSNVDMQTLGLSLNTKIDNDQSIMQKHTDLSSKLENPFKFHTLSTTEYIGALYSIIINREFILYSSNPINKERIIYLNSPLQIVMFDIDLKCISLAINKAYMNTITFLKQIDIN